MCQEIQVKTSRIKAWGDPSSKAHFQSSKTLWRSKQTPILELPKQGETLLSFLTEKAARKCSGTHEECKVLECRDRDQTFQHQRKLSQLWNHAGQGESSISEKSWKATGIRAAPTQVCSKPPPPFAGSCPRIIPVTGVALIPGTCCLPGQDLVIKWLLCKENTNMGFDPFVLCHSKEPKDSFFNFIVQNHHQKISSNPTIKSFSHTEVREQGTGILSHLDF